MKRISLQILLEMKLQTKNELSRSSFSKLYFPINRCFLYPLSLDKTVVTGETTTREGGNGFEKHQRPIEEN